jgi:hypothetical protein
MKRTSMKDDGLRTGTIHTTESMRLALMVVKMYFQP